MLGKVPFFINPPYTENLQLSCKKLRTNSTQQQDQLRTISISFYLSNK